MTTRRDFIRQATLLGAGLSMSPFFINATPGSVGANDKIRVGLIGCKGMGFSDLQAFLRNPERVYRIMRHRRRSSQQSRG